MSKTNVALRSIMAAVSAACAELPENSRVWTFHIWGFDGSLYLSRTLGPRLFGARPLLHRIWREDRDRYAHNHPWAWARFLIVSGGYTEERHGPDGRHTTRDLRPGDVNIIERDTLHRVVHVLPDTWTLGIVGPRVQDWGFMVDGALVPHKDYFARHGHIQKSEVT